jgi:DNA-binding beta-propeller fold protein YncE
MLKLLTPLVLAACVCISLPAQTAYVPINAPYAQNLLVTTKNAHPELQKLGLHAIPPGQEDYAIIANPIVSKIGKKSSAGDLSVLTSGKPSVKRNDEGKFFDLCLPISDAAGTPLGITVMEIPYAAAKDADDALAKATVIRNEMQRKIANHDELFEATGVPLKELQTIPLGAGIKGHFDHFGVDLKHNRLFAAAEDSQSVLVLNSTNAVLTTEIHNLSRPHAVLYRDDLDRVYVTDGGDGTLKIFDGKTYHLTGTVALSKDADSIGYDPFRHYLYIDNGGKDAGNSYSLVSVVDTTAGKKIADIRIDSDTLEAMALDIWRPRLYVNNRAQNSVVVIDRWKNRVVATWPLTMAKDNVAMGLDEQHGRLFVGCRSGEVVVFDTNTGKELQKLPINKGVDDMEFDVASQRLYAIGAGVIDVFQELDADHFRSLGSVAAGAGAKTARLVAPINRYFVAAPQTGAGKASVQVFQPLNTPVAKYVADTEVPQPVTAPRALQLELSTLSAHPDLRKMGLHAIPPGAKDSVIIANANTSRIGYKSSQGDLDAVKGGKTYCVKREDGSFYNAKLPLEDASGRVIGILVMEMPFTSVADEKEAIQKAEGIRQELARQIPSYQSLFQDEAPL